MSQPTRQQALEQGPGGTTTETTAILAGADAIATALDAADTAGKLGAAAGTGNALGQLQDQLTDLCEQIGQNLSA